MYLVKILGGLGPPTEAGKIWGEGSSPPQSTARTAYAVSHRLHLPNVDVQIIKDDNNRKNVFF